MSKFAIRLLTLAMFVARAGRRRPSSPRSMPRRRQRSRRRRTTGKKKKKASEARSSIERSAIRRRLSRRLCHDLRPQRLRFRDRAVEGARPRRQRRRRQSDRLLLSQARRLQGLADLVRARAEGRSEPRQDLAVLRTVAGRTGQPRPGAVSSEPDRASLPAPAARNIARSPQRWKSRRAPASSTEFRRTRQCSRRSRKACAGFVLAASHFIIACDLGAERLARGVARIEHVAAGIDHELDARRDGIGRQLVEHDLRAEIRRGQIEQPVPDQQLQLRIEREHLAQLGDRFRGLRPWPKSQALLTAPLSSS